MIYPPCPLCLGELETRKPSAEETVTQPGIKPASLTRTYRLGVKQLLKELGIGVYERDMIHVELTGASSSSLPILILTVTDTQP